VTVRLLQYNEELSRCEALTAVLRPKLPLDFIELTRK